MLEIQPKTRAKKQNRLPPQDRHAQILAAATELFAEVGFEAATRDLADRLGIKQPLIYRYFPSKEDLVQEVKEAVSVRRNRTAMFSLMEDAAVSIQLRIEQFYWKFTETAFEPTALRIGIYSALKSPQENEIAIFAEEEVFPLLSKHLRGALERPPICDLPINAREQDALWGCHGSIFFFGLRNAFLGLPQEPEALRKVISSSVAELIAEFRSTN